MTFTSTLESYSSLFGLPGEPSHEQVLFNTDAESACRTIIAIHNTQRGPAFGGCRMWSYADDRAALTDALRLAQGMSLKNALAGLPFGGGKAVIIRPSSDAFDRTAVFRAFGRAVHAAGGRYITAEDVGSTTSDMRVVQSYTPYVSGIPRAGEFGGDPSPKTAWGVFVAIDEAVRLHLKRPIAGCTVAVQGLGAVGMSLCNFLFAAGAHLRVADINPTRMIEAQQRFQAKAVDVNAILYEDVDVLAPCAMGAVLNSATVPLVNAAIVAGAANNQLETLEDGDALHARGVLYIPDFLANAGGIISVAREYLGSGKEDDVMQEVGMIRGRVFELLERLQGQAPARVADAWARERLHA